MDGTIYTEPKTSFEILQLEDDEGISFGAAYHPRRAGGVVPWHTGCDHCNRGRQVDIDPDVRRALLTLMSREQLGEYAGDHPINQYRIPTSTSSYIIKHWIEEDGDDRDHQAAIECPSGKSLYATLFENRPLKIAGDGEKRSVWLDRGLRLLFSARPATPAEISAVASSFEGTSSRGRRNPCLKIDWAKLRAEVAPHRKTA